MIIMIKKVIINTSLIDEKDVRSRINKNELELLKEVIDHVLED